MEKRRTLAALVVAAILAVPAAATAGPAGAQAPARDQRDAELGSLVGRTELLLAWTEDLGAGNRVMAKRLRSNGLPVGGAEGGAFELTAPTGPAGAKGDQRHPALGDGLLVWSERLPGGADFDLYAQRLSANGRATGSPRLIAGGPGDQLHADVVTGRNREWLVVWSEDSTDAGDVMGLRLSPALTVRGAPFEIAKGPGTAEDPTVAEDPSDASFFLVLWTDDRSGNRDIYGTRISANGLPRGSATVAHAPVVEAPEDDYAPFLLTGPTGERESRGLLLWTRDTVTDGPDVLAQRIRSNGFAVGPVLTVAGGTGIQAWSTAAFVPARGSAGTGARVGPDLVRPGEWLAAWSQDPLGTMDIYGVEIGLNGISRRAPRALVAE